MIVDIHVHLPRLYRGSTNLDELVPEVEKMLDVGTHHGIDQQVILGLSLGDESNRVLGQLAERFPNRFIPFMRGSFQDPDCPGQLERAVKQYGCKGIKLHGEKPRFPLTGILAAHSIYEKAAELGVPVLFHSWHEEEGLEAIYPDLLGAGHFPVLLMEELGKTHPETQFIMAHVGGQWTKAFQAAQPYPNVSFDVSGFDAERGIVEKAVEVLGAERVYWGSDAPGRNYATQLAKVKYADISEADKALILGGNAARLLNLR